MSARPILLLKLGGSLITDKTRPRTARPGVISRLANELAETLSDGDLRVVVAHGSGSFGHPAAVAHRLDQGAHSPTQRRGASETQSEARVLHRLVTEALYEAGLAPFSLAPGSFLVADHGRVTDCFAAPLQEALRSGMLPVVFGDVLLDRSRGVTIGSTEMVLEALAGSLAAAGDPVSRVVWLGNTDGVLNGDGQLVQEISRADSAQLGHWCGAAAGTDITGGMIHRVETTLRLAAAGIESVIANGEIPGILADLLTNAATHGTLVRS